MAAATTASASLSQNSMEIPSGAFASSSAALGSSSAVTSSLAPHSDISSSSKTLRGLNKPKCIKCGNVARSRCPFQSCKSCCAKAQNPCHIHVLKGGSNIPDKIPPFGTQKTDQQSTDVAHSTSSHRTTSLRTLSSNFSQFNSLQSPARSKKPLTGKDAELINEWRFMKLKEFRDRNIEAENEAFGRYMLNISLLEEVFSVNSSDDNESSAMDTVGSADDAMLKSKLRSDPVRKENMRKRIQYIVDQGLKSLKKFGSSRSINGDDAVENDDDPDETGGTPKRLKSEPADNKTSLLNELIDKLNKAKTEEDLKACYDLKSELFKNRSPISTTGESSTVKAAIDESPTPPQSRYSPKKWFKTVPIDQETLTQIDTWFSSVEDIEEL